MKKLEHIIAQVRKRYTLAREGLDERGRRQVAAAEALTLGWGGVRLVAEATGMARATITLGLKELRGQVALAPTGKRRRPGGGRKAIVAQDPRGAGRTGAAGGADYPWRPRVAAALDVQEHA